MSKDKDRYMQKVENVGLIPGATLFPLLAVSIYFSMKGSDRREICMIAFPIPCINSAVGMNS